jgi:hypothetical protein
MSDLHSRAVRAYFAAAKRKGDQCLPPPQPAGVGTEVTHKGRDYYVLDNCKGTLAVYRVLPSGSLRGLKRWPKDVAAAA